MLADHALSADGSTGKQQAAVLALLKNITVLYQSQVAAAAWRQQI
jgi:hypothetical protein